MWRDMRGRMKLRLIGLLALLVLGVTAVSAQTYSTTLPFTCNAASHYPVTDFSQFNCRGVSYKDAGGVVQAETFVPEFEIFTPNWTISSLHSSLVVTEFSTSDGTFSYTWSGTDMNGNPHSGTCVGTWTEIKDWRGWYHPVIRTSSLTVLQ
jgi:hypothetical protein